MEKAKHILYIILILSITAGCYYLHTLSQRLETNNVYLKELIQYNISNDTLNTDTAKINILKTQEHEK